MGEFARRVEETYRGQTIVCFSHAASVALVAAFLKCSMREFKFAPCGVYELKRRGDGPWELVSNGEANAHVSENSPTTYPWGFGEKHFKEGEGKYYGESEVSTNIDLKKYVNRLNQSDQKGAIIVQSSYTWRRCIPSAIVSYKCRVFQMPCQ
eukprot:13171079-Ditylum_brightwellii.AAC.1